MYNSALLQDCHSSGHLRHPTAYKLGQHVHLCSTGLQQGSTPFVVNGDAR